MIESKKIYCQVEGLDPEKARYHCLAHIPPDWSFRLEFTIDQEKGGFLLQLRGITKEAGAANSDGKFNCNNVATLPLKSIKVNTLDPYPSLSGYNYPFGIMVFSHQHINSERYAALVNSIMPTILHKFISLFDHTPDSLNLLLSTPSNQITGNSAQYQPAYSTNFAPANFAPATQVQSTSDYNPLIQQTNENSTASHGSTAGLQQDASALGLQYNQATGNQFFFSLSLNIEAKSI